jgi:hypothetical protein
MLHLHLILYTAEGIEIKNNDPKALCGAILIGLCETSRSSQVQLVQAQQKMFVQIAEAQLAT